MLPWANKKPSFFFKFFCDYKNDYALHKELNYNQNPIFERKLITGDLII